MTHTVYLPHIGRCQVYEVTPGHFLWLSLFGWHDCHPHEDTLILGALR